MAKKTTNFQKLINLIEGFEAKREAKYVPMDVPTTELYHQIVQWSRYADEALMSSRWDLTKLIYGKINEYIELLRNLSDYLNTGKFSEHKEADVIYNEWSAIFKLWKIITEDLFDTSAAWEDDDDDENVE